MRYQPTFQLRLHLILFLFIAFVACNNSSSNSNAASSTPESLVNQPSEPLPICYAFTSATDTIDLKLLIQTNQTVTGDLVYKLSGKDINQGTIRGTLKNDTIFADYNFWSEGKESIRQIVFLKSDSTITEGFGPVEEINGEMRFTKDAVHDFSKGLKLFLTNCKN